MPQPGLHHPSLVALAACRQVLPGGAQGSCDFVSPPPQGLKISVLWTLYYGILSAFAPVYSWILVLRGLVGFGIGGVPQS